MEVSEPLFHEVFVSFFFKNYLIETFLFGPPTGPVQESICIGLLRSLVGTAGVCVEVSSLAV